MKSFSAAHLFYCLIIFDKLSTSDELNAFLKSSVLWHYAQKLSLKINMPVQLQHDAKQLWNIVNGKIKIDEFTQFVTATTHELIHKVFQNIVQNYKNHQGMLTVKNDDVNAKNFSI